MGYRSKEWTILTAFMPQGDAGSLVPGSLVAVTLQIRYPVVAPAASYGRIFISESKPEAFSTVHHLADGYTGWINPLTWSGAIPVGNEHFIMGIVRAPLDTVCRLTWWTLDKYTAATGVPRDP